MHDDNRIRSPNVPPMTNNLTYVLMTAAHNEEAHIKATIDAVVAQTKLPARWAIVSDNSDDKTDEIIQTYATQHLWITYIRVDRFPGRSFASKITALQASKPILRNESFSHIGNLDADVTLEPTYFETLLNRFNANPNLGLASGFVYEEVRGQFVSRTLNSEQSVPHGAQLVRRDCYESIGGYAVLRHGGEDWHALVSARMRGWQVEAFRDLKIFHHRPTNTLGGMIKNAFRAGRMDYSFGSYFPFETLKCLRRLSHPYYIDGFVRMSGFLLSHAMREERAVPSELAEFLRKEQKTRALTHLTGVFRTQ